eukprot:60655-Pyramimonas_sp.AAC.1
MTPAANVALGSKKQDSQRPTSAWVGPRAAGLLVRNTSHRGPTPVKLSTAHFELDNVQNIK